MTWSHLLAALQPNVTRKENKTNSTCFRQHGGSRGCHAERAGELSLLVRGEVVLINRILSRQVMGLF